MGAPTCLVLNKLACLVYIIFFAQMAVASCYITSPVATTVLVAGQPATIRWNEDGRQPLMQDLGHMDLQLLARNDTPIANLSRSVDLFAMKTTVYIPRKLPPDIRRYTLRFVPAHFGGNKKNVSSYSATFIIIQNPFEPLNTRSHEITKSQFMGTRPHSSTPSLTHITGIQQISPTSNVAAQTVAHVPGPAINGAGGKNNGRQKIVTCIGWLAFMGLTL